MDRKKQNVNRRDFLKKSVNTAAASLLAPYILTGCSSSKNVSRRAKVIILGIDGMDPGLCEQMMAQGELPNFNRLRQQGGYAPLRTTLPPQSPVAWAGFITGANPGAHGIFDFVHRKPEQQSRAFSGFSETVAGADALRIGSHQLPLPFWPFNHESSRTILRRQGVPFWDYLDEKNISSQIYLIPSNYPPGPSKHGHHTSFAGMGIPDITGNRGMYQYFTENGPAPPRYEGSGWRAKLTFNNHSASARLLGPPNQFLVKPESTFLDFTIHRDPNAATAAIDIQQNKILLKKGQWSNWIKLEFDLSIPLMPDEHVRGICRFFLRKIWPEFQLYVSPVNIDPAEPAMQISQPQELSKQMVQELGLFSTLGFQEDFNARIYNALNDEEFAVQAQMVLDQRFKMLDYALDHYDEGVLFFYFSNTDLESHIFWWDTQRAHPFRSAYMAKKYHNRIPELYKKMDNMLGEIMLRFGKDKETTILVLSDHGFASLKKMFSLNRWLRDEGYLKPFNATALTQDTDWSDSKAYALGLNGLYLNVAGRERDGIVKPGPEKELLINELTEKLENLHDEDGNRIINRVLRSDKEYHGNAAANAPDLIVGYNRGYRNAYGSGVGTLSEEVLVLCKN